MEVQLRNQYLIFLMNFRDVFPISSKKIHFRSKRYRLDKVDPSSFGLCLVT